MDEGEESDGLAHAHRPGEQQEILRRDAVLQPGQRVGVGG